MQVNVLLYKEQNQATIMFVNQNDEIFFWSREHDLPGAIINTRIEKIIKNQAFCTLNGRNSIIKLGNEKTFVGAEQPVKIIATAQEGKGPKCQLMDKSATLTNADIYEFIRENINENWNISTNNREIWSHFKQKFPDVSIDCHDNAPNPSENYVFSLAEQQTEILDNGAILHCYETNAGAIIDVDSHQLFDFLQNDNDIMKFNEKLCPNIIRYISLKSLSGLIFVDFIKPKNRGLLKNIIPKMQSLSKKYMVKSQILGFGPAGLCELTVSAGVAPLSERVFF